MLWVDGEAVCGEGVRKTEIRVSSYLGVRAAACSRVVWTCCYCLSSAWAVIANARLCPDGAVAWCSLTHEWDTGTEPDFLLDLPLCKQVSSLHEPHSAPLPPLCSSSLHLTQPSGTLLSHRAF